MCTPQLIQQAAQIKAAQEMQQQSPISQTQDPSAYARPKSVADAINSSPAMMDVVNPIEGGFVPITREEFMNDGPIRQVPMIQKQITPIAPVRRTQTVGELLGIPPGSVPGI